MTIDEAFPVNAVTDPADRAANRNVWLPWALGRINEADAYLNNTLHWDRGANPVTEHQARVANDAADRLERMAADLRAIAARRIKPLELVKEDAA